MAVKRALLAMTLGILVVAMGLSSLLLCSLIGASRVVQIPTFTPADFDYLPLALKVWLATDRPDLVIVRARTSMRGYTGGCVTDYSPLETQVCVDNQGTAPATAFVVEAGALTWQIGRLAPGEQRCVEGEGEAALAVVDVRDEVIESDETNNSAWLAIPTPPPICTPAPGPPMPTYMSTPTHTPTPTATPTP